MGDRVYIGYDTREEAAYQVCRASIERFSNQRITPIREEVLRSLGVYTRQFTIENGQRYDIMDKKPFSTDFSFTRFFVPYINKYDGWALFCDCDFLFRADLADLFALKDEKYAVMCVKHDYKPKESTKMDGQIQQPYARKNWSSLVLWNCAHASNAKLTRDKVNTRPGSSLHGFEWLKDEEIGELSPEWNFLVGSQEPTGKEKGVHFTLGTPDIPGYENSSYADEWRATLEGTKQRDAI